MNFLSGLGFKGILLNLLPERFRQRIQEYIRTIYEWL